MIDRRKLLIGGLVAPALFRTVPARATAAASLPIPDGNRLTFHVIRNDSVIGQHTLTFEPTGDTLTVSVVVDISVGIGPISLFRYTHRAVERWQDGKVVAVDAKTDDDGTDLQMTARRQDNGLVVEGSKVPNYTAPPHALPATHWNRAMLDGPLINTQNGKLMTPAVTLVGQERVTVGQNTVDAQHYQLRGDADLDTWYDLTPSWVALRFTAKDGSVIRYQRA